MLKEIKICKKIEDKKMKDIHDFYFSRYFKEICWYYGEDHIYIEEPGIIAAKIIQNPQRIVSIVQLDDGTQTLNQYQWNGKKHKSEPLPIQQKLKGFAEETIPNTVCLLTENDSIEVMI